LATTYGLQAVGYYLTAAAALTFLALLGLGRYGQTQTIAPVAQRA
jgi:hypothetical protein